MDGIRIKPSNHGWKGNAKQYNHRAVNKKIICIKKHEHWYMYNEKVIQNRAEKRKENKDTTKSEKN